MRIRNGFVSNSSSSSFVIFGKYVGIDKIDDANVQIYEGYGSDGSYYYRPSQDIIEYIKANPEKCPKLFCEYLSLSESQLISKSMLLKILSEVSDSEYVQIETFEKDYHCPEDVEDFKRSIGEE